MRKLKISKFKDWSLLDGTSLQGYVNAEYATLVNVFGINDGGLDTCKSDAAWDLIINGVVCTIYNYKDGKNYLGAKGLAVENITCWHIGGRDKRSVQLVNAAIEQHFATV